MSDEFKRHKEIARNNGISDSLFSNRIKLGWSYERASTQKVRKRSDEKHGDVAIYKGDQFILWGSLEEVAEKLGRTEKEIKYICFPSHRKRVENDGQRTYGIYIEDEE